MTEATERFEAWAIVELFGHQKIAGRITEQTIGGCHFIRVDVPDINGRAGFTKLYGQGAIYAITFVEEAVAKMAAAGLKIEPVRAYELDDVKVNYVRQRLTHSDDDD